LAKEGLAMFIRYECYVLIIGLLMGHVTCLIQHYLIFSGNVGKRWYGNCREKAKCRFCPRVSGVQE
jgi:hypothetical protein